MAIIVYGTHVFTKLTGYYGQREECPVCHRIYQKGYVRNTVWAHLEYIPLFPVKKEPYAKHVLAKKPTGFMSTDNSYEFWIRDLMTGEEILVASDITKDQVKQIKKSRGYKKVPIVNAQE